MPKRLAFDIDGVFADFPSSLLRMIQYRKKGEVLTSTFSRWSWQKDLLTPEEETTLWTYINTTPRWWSDGVAAYLDTPYELSYLDTLRQRGHQLFFVTNRTGPEGPVQQHTAAWLAMHGFSEASVICCRNKARVLNALRVDLFVDDRPKNLIRLHTKHAYLFDRPWNQGEERWPRISTLKFLLEEYQ